MSQNTDRELLELAAKAAGIVHEGWFDSLDLDYYDPRNGSEGLLLKWFHSEEAWNPLTDDGDALRLVVKIGQSHFIDIYIGKETSIVSFDDGSDDLTEVHGSDGCAATRRAIVRAAAEIGRGMNA